MRMGELGNDSRAPPRPAPESEPFCAGIALTTRPPLRYLISLWQYCGCPPDSPAPSAPRGSSAVFLPFLISGRVSMSTYFPKQGEIVRKWFVVDASGQTLGGWRRKSPAS